MRAKFFYYYIEDMVTGDYYRYNIADNMSCYCLSIGGSIGNLFVENTESKNVFRVTLPIISSQFASVNRKQKTSKPIDSILDEGAALEKITYLYLSDKHDIFAITSNLNGADADDIVHFVNSTFDLIENKRFKLRVHPIHYDSKKEDISSFKCITSVGFQIDAKSSQKGFMNKFLKKDIPEGMVAEIKLKRVSQQFDITEDIRELMTEISSDDNDSYQKLSVSAIRDERDRTLKNIILDNKNRAYVYETIYPASKTTIEEQMSLSIDKSTDVVRIANEGLQSREHAFNKDAALNTGELLNLAI